MTIAYTRFTPFWTLEDNGQIIDLMEDLIPRMPHSEQAKYLSEEGFRLGGLKDHFKLFEMLYAGRADSNSEQLRLFLKKSLRRDFLNCSTTIQHNSQGLDVIQHYGLDGLSETLEADLTGDGWEAMDKVLSSEACLSLTGKSLDEVKELSCYINGTPFQPFVKTIPRRQKTEARYGIRLNANTTRTYIRLNGELNVPTFALGLRLRKPKQREL